VLGLAFGSALTVDIEVYMQAPATTVDGTNPDALDVQKVWSLSSSVGPCLRRRVQIWVVEVLLGLAYCLALTGWS
jgi:hypothetical protein